MTTSQLAQSMFEKWGYLVCGFTYSVPIGYSFMLRLRSDENEECRLVVIAPSTREEFVEQAKFAGRADSPNWNAPLFYRVMAE